MLQEPVPKIYRKPIRSISREIKMTLTVSLFNITKKIDSAVAAETVLPTSNRESSRCSPFHIDLDPEITDFCSRLEITPANREFQFHDNEADSDLDPSVSDHTSDIEKESELKRFTQALQRAQTVALKKEKENKRGPYTKQSKRTQKRRQQLQIDFASKGFLPLDQYMSLKSVPVKHDKLTSELDEIAAREESEDDSDEPNALDQEYTNISDTSDVEYKGNLPGTLHIARLHPTHHARMESEESSGDDDCNVVGDYARQCISEDNMQAVDHKETHTARKCLEDIRQEAVEAHQMISRCAPSSTSQLLNDHSKLREVSTQLTGEMKTGDHDVIVRGRVAAMIGLLNLYTAQNLKYSWKRASEIVAETQGRGTHHARSIREWVMGFLRWRDLPLHQLNRKRGTLLDDEDIAGEIKMKLTEKTKGGFLKAQDVVEVVASPNMQEIFAQKGITKVSISTKTALRWLEKMGWSYGKLKNGMYLDGHERSDVVEYRQAFVERWMGHERRFHRWNHDGSELPRPNGFPVPGSIGRFRLILVTHDESTFFQNDERNTGWSHPTSKSKPKAKGNGQSIMVSDFLTPDWGRLRDGDE